MICLHQMPKTNCFSTEDNQVSKKFWGRIPLNHAAALFMFQKKGNLQKLIYELKYNRKPEVGYFLGKLLAYAIADSSYIKNLDLIIPVPLHIKKERLRGYNQSFLIAKGIKEVLNTKIDTTSLVRIENTDSQTRKKRFSRWENMMNSFALTKESQLKNKHILLVDDVITTGATLEACTQKLLIVDGVKVSIAAIAVV